jgi:hypothetical protein
MLTVTTDETFITTLATTYLEQFNVVFLEE